MDRAEDEIQFVPVSFDPVSASRRSLRIIIELDPRANFEIAIIFAKPVDFVEINPGVIAVVVGERDFPQTAPASGVGPRL